MTAVPCGVCTLYLYCRALLSAESLLDHLEAGDGGADSPSVATAHQLRRAGLAPLSSHIAAGRLGKPYLWAQRLAGLDFTAPAAAAQVGHAAPNTPPLTHRP